MSILSSLVGKSSMVSHNMASKCLCKINYVYQPCFWLISFDLSTSTDRTPRTRDTPAYPSPVCSVKQQIMQRFLTGCSQNWWIYHWTHSRNRKFDLKVQTQSAVSQHDANDIMLTSSSVWRLYAKTERFKVGQYFHNKHNKINSQDIYKNVIF